jgi:transposase
VIRIDAAWFAVEPLDMRAGVDKSLARVVDVFGEARAHHAYLFINKRANRMKVLVNDGFGLWLCARKLYEGSFIVVFLSCWHFSPSNAAQALRHGNR